MESISVFEALERLNKDLRQAAKTMTKAEARYLVDNYYIMQENRKRADGQIRAMSESAEPHAIIVWLSQNASTLEKNIKSALDIYSDSDPLGVWAKSQVGIGPVITAGLLAHIDITKAATVSQIWRFAGLDPTVKWEKGQKRPWNANLKTLCWKIGESFVKVCNNEDAVYGKLYVQRKEQETAKNEAGDFKDQAAVGAARVGKKTEAYGHYSGGKLPPAHVHARAKRYAVKMFLSHYHAKGRELAGLPVPTPYAIAHLNHEHLIAVPE